MATLQLNRKKRDILLRKSDILKAAESVFARKDYYRATIADIAQEAQYGVGTIYLYFKDKQSLYISLFEEKMRRLINLIKEKVEKTADDLEKIKVLVKTELHFFTTNENFFRIFFSTREGLQLKVKDMVSSAVMSLIFQLLDYTSEIIKQAQSKGVIKKDYHPRKIAFILQHLVRSAIIPHLIDGRKTEREDITRQSCFVVEVFLNGIGTK